MINILECTRDFSGLPDLSKFSDGEILSIIDPIKINKPDLVIWFENYKDINKDNTAQQEATAINYNIGTMELDYGDKDLKAILQDLLDDSPMGRQAKKNKLANAEKADKKDKIN